MSEEQKAIYERLKQQGRIDGVISFIDDNWRINGGAANQLDYYFKTDELEFLQSGITIDNGLDWIKTNLLTKEASDV